jgi:hypothetical protein
LLADLVAVGAQRQGAVRCQRDLARGGDLDLGSVDVVAVPGLAHERGDGPPRPVTDHHHVQSGFHIACIVAAAICAAGALGALLLPGRIREQTADPTVPESDLVTA